MLEDKPYSPVKMQKAPDFLEPDAFWYAFNSDH